MNKTLTVVFDGDVLCPDAPLDLEPNTRYVITVQSEFSLITEGDAWDVLDSLTGTVEAPHDWASEHDHYLYGTPTVRTRYAKASARDYRMSEVSG